MKTATRVEHPNRWALAVQQPSTWCGPSKQILLIQTGARKQQNSSPLGEIFLLTFPFILDRFEQKPLSGLLFETLPGLAFLSFLLVARFLAENFAPG